MIVLTHWRRYRYARHKCESCHFSKSGRKNPEFECSIDPCYSFTKFPPQNFKRIDTYSSD